MNENVAEKTVSVPSGVQRLGNRVATSKHLQLNASARRAGSLFVVYHELLHMPASTPSWEPCHVWSPENLSLGAKGFPMARIKGICSARRASLLPFVPSQSRLRTLHRRADISGLIRIDSGAPSVIATSLARDIDMTSPQ